MFLIEEEEGAILYQSTWIRNDFSLLIFRLSKERCFVKKMKILAVKIRSRKFWLRGCDKSLLMSHLSGGRILEATNVTSNLKNLSFSRQNALISVDYVRSDKLLLNVTCRL